MFIFYIDFYFRYVIIRKYWGSILYSPNIIKREKAVDTVREVFLLL